MNAIAKKRVLFLDDDPVFLDMARDVFGALSQGSWDILIAQHHAEALSLLGKSQIHVAVLDVDMPVMDGVHFLHLVQRIHPGLPTVMLTGCGTPEIQKKCMAEGACLFLEKSPDTASLFKAIDAVALTPGSPGFQGMMRRVGLNEVLQLECLGSKSSILEVFTGTTRGRIYTCDGAIIHAEVGQLRGEMALYGLLALRGGGFNLLPFVEPPERTISGPWEFLLMEGARVADEGGLPEILPEPSLPVSDSFSSTSPEAARDTAGISRVQIEEMLLCSGGGEVLYYRGGGSEERGRLLMADLEEKGRRLLGVAPLGAFEGFESLSDQGRCVCEIDHEKRVLVRSVPTAGIDK